MINNVGNTREITYHIYDLLQRDAKFYFERLALIGDGPLQSVVWRQQLVQQTFLVTSAQAFCNRNKLLFKPVWNSPQQLVWVDS